MSKVSASIKTVCNNSVSGNHRVDLFTSRATGTMMMDTGGVVKTTYELVLVEDRTHMKLNNGDEHWRCSEDHIRMCARRE